MAKRSWKWFRPLRARNTKAADSVREVRDEIETYLAHRTRELVEAGHAPADAARIAREASSSTARKRDTAAQLFCCFRWRPWLRH